MAMNTVSPPDPDTATKRGRKYDDVIDGARRAFLRDGFDGTSVDKIAREAGVSKATLYSYFNDKRLLFLEVARLECAQLAEQSKRQVNLTAPPDIVLPFAGRIILSYVSSPLALGIYRLCVAEAERFPELGRLFYQSGPLAARASLTEYLQGCVARGELVIPDLDLATSQFCELCRGDEQTKQVFGISRPPSAQEIDRIVDSAVAMFLSFYTPR